MTKQRLTVLRAQLKNLKNPKVNYGFTSTYLLESLPALLNEIESLQADLDEAHESIDETCEIANRNYSNLMSAIYENGELKEKLKEAKAKHRALVKASK